MACACISHHRRVFNFQKNDEVSFDDNVRNFIFSFLAPIRWQSVINDYYLMISSNGLWILHETWSWFIQESRNIIQYRSLSQWQARGQLLRGYVTPVHSIRLTYWPDQVQMNQPNQDKYWPTQKFDMIWLIYSPLVGWNALVS